MIARLLTVALALLVATPVANAATYEVGAGKPYATPSAVPWESLQPGDLVLIYWQATPYKDKWVICRQGTAAAPIVVRGVAGPGGERPVIDGNGAVTRLALDYWGEQRAVIKIGGASIPADTMPKYIVIEGLDIRSARPPYSVHRRRRGQRVLREQRRRGVDREGRAHHGSQQHPARQRQRPLRQLGRAQHLARHPDRGQLHLRQRQRRQHLRAQHLHRGAGHHLPVQPLRAAARRRAAATT